MGIRNGLVDLFLEIDCGPLGPLHNGWIENIEAGTGFGASVIFRCEKNMTMLGNASSVCQQNGTWTHQQPLCLGNARISTLTEWFVFEWLYSPSHQLPL